MHELPHTKCFSKSLEAVAFPAIRAEAAQRGTDTRRRDQFVLLGHAGAALEQFVSDDADPDAIEEYAEFIHQGYQFQEFGCRLYSFSEYVTRELTQEEYDVGDWTFAGPPACYLQFPHSPLAGARDDELAPHQLVDGCFVVVDGTEPAPGAGAPEIAARVRLARGSAGRVARVVSDGSHADGGA